MNIYNIYKRFTMICNIVKVERFVKDEDELKRFVVDIFKKLDKDKSGFIDKHQMANLLSIISEELGFVQPLEHDAGDLARIFDTNRDQRVSKSEFQKVIEYVLKILSKQLLVESKRTKKY